MQGVLTASNREDLLILTLSRADEKSAPYLTLKKRVQGGETEPKEVFHGGRNFK